MDREKIFVKLKNRYVHLPKTFHKNRYNQMADSFSIFNSLLVGVSTRKEIRVKFYYRRIYRTLVMLNVLKRPTLILGEA